MWWVGKGIELIFWVRIRVLFWGVYLLVGGVVVFVYWMLKCGDIVKGKFGVVLEVVNNGGFFEVRLICI